MLTVPVSADITAVGPRSLRDDDGARRPAIRMVLHHPLRSDGVRLVFRTRHPSRNHVTTVLFRRQGRPHRRHRVHRPGQRNPESGSVRQFRSARSLSGQ